MSEAWRRNIYFKTDRTAAQAEREERESLARRGGERAPVVAANLSGKPSLDEVRKWTTYLPKAPPGRKTNDA